MSSSVKPPSDQFFEEKKVNRHPELAISNQKLYIPQASLQTSPKYTGYSAKVF